MSGVVKTVIGNNFLIELEAGMDVQATVDSYVFKVGVEVKIVVIVCMDLIIQIIFVTLKDKCKVEKERIKRAMAMRKGSV